MTAFKKKSLYLSVCSILFFSAPHLEAAQSAKDETAALPVLKVKSVSDTNTYAATKAVSGLKSDTPLFKTAQTVNVITSEQLNQKQAFTLSDAIRDVAGVSAGNRSRRGWDDFSIRGQSASNQIFIDGMRAGTGNDVAIDPVGYDQIQVIKGPASVNFGQALPGGIVNLVSKRPEAKNFANADLTYGSYDFRQAQFDLNYSPNQTKEGSFRLTGRIADQNDQIDHVYFKNFYISPSYNFDLGEKAKLSTVASYQHREYVRMQGLPVVGTLKTNPNGQLQNSDFFGEPSFGPYKGDVYRLGYTFNYAFEDGWVFEHNAAVRKADMDGRFVSMRRWVPTSNYTTIVRRANAQDYSNLTYTVDNNLKNTFNFDGMSHAVMAGVDAMSDRSHQSNFDCSISNFNFYNPIYNTKVDCSNRSGFKNTITKTQYVGVYLRDQITIQDNLIINLAGRHDWAKTSSSDKVTGVNTHQNHQAFTGSASALYTINNWVAPYVSYSTSFVPSSGITYSGTPFEPLKGKQLEAGFKFQNESQNLQATLSWYDLALDNVSVADQKNSGFQVQDGQQKTRGVEAEIIANLSNKLRLNASFSHMYDAKVSKDTNIARIGQRLENTPENTYSLSMRYYPITDVTGWYIGGGVRGESAKPIIGDASINVPAYTLFDAEAGYDAQNWGAQLSVQNMFDKNYYAGTIANQTNDNRLVAQGNPRQINFTLKFKY